LYARSERSLAWVGRAPADWIAASICPAGARRRGFSSMRALHTCMLCEAVCGLEVELEGGRVVAVRGDEVDPFAIWARPLWHRALGELLAGGA